MVLIGAKQNFLRMVGVDPDSPGELSFLRERRLEARVDTLVDFCGEVSAEAQLPPDSFAPPLVEHAAREFRFLVAATRVARRRHIEPRLIPAFLQLLALPNLVRANMRIISVPWPEIPANALHFRSEKTAAMLYRALMLEDAGWLDCQLRDIRREWRDHATFSDGRMWRTGAIARDSVVAYPLQWSERIGFGSAWEPFLSQRTLQLGMWLPREGYAARGTTVGWWLEIMRRVAADTDGDPEPLRQADGNTLRLVLGDALAADVRVEISRSPLGPHGAVGAERPTSVSVYVSWGGTPPVFQRNSKKFSVFRPVAVFAGFASGREARRYGRPPAVILNPKDGGNAAVEGTWLREMVGPGGGAAFLHGWDAIRHDTLATDAALLFAVFWARQVSTNQLGRFPIIRGVDVEGGAVRPAQVTRWHDAFTTSEWVGILALMRTMFREVAERELSAAHGTNSAARSCDAGTKHLLANDLAAVSDRQVAQLFGQLVERFHAPDRGGSLRAYVARWLRTEVPVLGDAIVEKRLKAAESKNGGGRRRAADR